MDLGRTQFLSLLTKAITTGLGLVQSFIVIRLLSAGEFGLVGLVMSIGGVIGVSQHLGIVDGAIREIAVQTDKQVIGRIFWISHITRQLVTIPLSLILIALAPWIAGSLYKHPEITPYIQLFAVVLILQGLQDVLGATLTGLKLFKTLYRIQIITAAVNIVAFGYLTWRYSILGFFWAIIITTLLMVGLLAWVALRHLQGYLSWPKLVDIRQYGSRLLRIGLYMYLARICFVIWQRLPILILGGVLAAEQLGYINVSLTFGARLTIIAMALSEVNLAWMSSLYAQERQKFNEVVTHNMQRVLVLMLSLTLALLFFVPEILLIIGHDYAPAKHLILFMTCAFFLYSLTDIGTSSVFVSADNPRFRALAYGVMTGLTALVTFWLLWADPNPLLASVAVLLGAIVAYVTMLLLAHYKLGVRLLTPALGWLLALLTASVLWLYFDPALPWRIVVFLLVAGYTVYEAHRSRLLPPQLQIQREAKRPQELLHIICFAGAPYDQLAWTNRQQIMSRVSQQYPVLYVEPRMWVFRIIAKYWRHPTRLWSFIQRVFWYEKKHDYLFIKAQWNLIPGSREFAIISRFNHYLNRFSVKLIAQWLHFNVRPLYLWIYDTEAVEFLNIWPQAKVLYDCVDDHAAQAGMDRNPRRVEAEEAAIMEKANLVTVTSQKLFELKKEANPNVHLVLNSGDVELFSQAFSEADRLKAQEFLQDIPHPRLGAVGALDGYKLDFALLHQVASQRPDWHFVLIGTPVVEQNNGIMKQVRGLPNVHFTGAIHRQSVPAFVQEFDICLIPYISSRYNEASFPLKFWEFMATGKPIIVTGLPELKPYREVIGYATTSEEFMSLVEEWLQHPDQQRAQRQHLAAGHTWQHRVDTILDLIAQTL